MTAAKRCGRSAGRKVILCLVTCVFVLGIWGCSGGVVRYVHKEKPRPVEELTDCYDRTMLKASNSLDVLGGIQDPERELLSQSDSVVASFGQSKDGYKTWFTMVAFDEHKMTARRKYFFMVDEKVRRGLGYFRKGLRFDSEIVLDRAVLEQPYATERAKRIVVLNYVSANFLKDINSLGEDVMELGSDNKMLGVCAMLTNQILETVRLKLARSPVLASKLSDEEGVDFDHINFDKGKLRMVIEDDVVKLRARLGTLLRDF